MIKTLFIAYYIANHSTYISGFGILQLALFGYGKYRQTFR